MARKIAEPKAAVTSKPTPKPISNKLTSRKEFWQLFKASVKFLRQHWRALAPILLVGLLPPSLLSLIGATGNSTYLSLLGLLMSIALLWSIIRLSQGESAKVREAYYYGTASFVRFILVSTALVLYLLPMFFGGVVLSAAALPGAALGGDWFIVIAVWLLLALPTIYWLTHYIFSPFILVQGENVSPLAALRASKSLVKGRGRRVAANLALLVVFLLLISLLPGAALVLAYSWTKWTFISSLAQLLLPIVLLPLAYIFIFLLKQKLSDG